MEATIGGTRRHLVDVARGQRRRGFDVCLAISAEREPRFRQDLAALAGEGVRVEEIPMVRAVRPGLDLRHLRRLEGLLREFEPDIVHTHSSKAGVLGRLASAGTDVGQRVHTPHTFAFLFGAEFGPLRRRLFRELESALAQLTQRTVAVSAGEAATFRASGVVPADRIRVVPNGVDPAAYLSAMPIARGDLGVPENAPLIAVVGLLHVAKGQDLLLQALRAPGLERAHALVVGDGEWRAHLEQLSRSLGVETRAHFLGWREDVPAILCACDCLALPSRWEGLPYIVIEASLAGLPIVATRVDGAGELLRDGESGILVELESADELGAALARVLALPREQRLAMGRLARERALAGYSLERMVDGLSAVYAELA
jgi:glycosyltransferase involved in cell wall biosynthesis